MYIYLKQAWQIFFFKACLGGCEYSLYYSLSFLVFEYLIIKYIKVSQSFFNAM